MAYAPFQVTVTTSAVQLDVTAESDIPSTSSPVFEEYVGSAIEFDVGAADIYVGPTNAVTSSSTGRGRKYTAGTHVEMKLNKGEHLWAVTASGSSVCEGSQVGV